MDGSKNHVTGAIANVHVIFCTSAFNDDKFAEALESAKSAQKIIEGYSQGFLSVFHHSSTKSEPPIKYCDQNPPKAIINERAQ